MTTSALRIYLAGPMSGYTDDNHPLFNKVAAYLRAVYGYTIVNPADNFGGAKALPYEQAMPEDIRGLLGCDAIAFLPGWEVSEGAGLEARIAVILGLKTYRVQETNGGYALYSITVHFPDGHSFAGKAQAQAPTETTLEEAQRLIHGPRNEDYGHPIHDFGRTGRIWAAILGLPNVTPEQVGLCMVGVKISRQCNKPKRDNLVDGCGYFGTIEMIQDERARLAQGEGG